MTKDEWVKRLRRLLKKGARAVPDHTMLIELLIAAAAIHRAMRYQGQRLSREDFIGWAGDCYDRFVQEDDN